jgi:L-fucose isomerase-like protein
VHARILDRFGVRIEKRSFRALGAEAKLVSDVAPTSRTSGSAGRPGSSDLPERNRRAALKLYLAIKAELGDDPAIQGAGINCLNESFFSDSTPCLAWNLLYEERGLTWGCEADTVSMLTQLLLQRSLQAPLMMTNLYPFLMGQAALKHERIAAFPDRARPREPRAGRPLRLPRRAAHLDAESWTLREKVLAIVDDDASAIDARLPEGPVTLAKLAPSMGTLTVVEGELSATPSTRAPTASTAASCASPTGTR